MNAAWKDNKNSQVKKTSSARKTNLSVKQSLPCKFTSRHVCQSLLCCLISQRGWLRHQGSSKLLGIRSCLGQEQSTGSSWLSATRYHCSSLALLTRFRTGSHSSFMKH